MHQNAEPYSQDQLVVDLLNLQRVGDELHELGVGYIVEQDEQLGLALLTGLTDETGTPVTDLDALLSELRRQFGRSVPLMGKNRETGVIGNPIGSLAIGPMALGLPIGSLGPKPMAGYDPEWDEWDTSSGLPEPPGPGTGDGVHIGILDGSLCWHESFDKRHVAAGRQFWPGFGPVAPWTGHATFVASLVRANAPDARLDVVGVLESSTARSSLWDTAKQMMLLAEAGVQILNLSLGTSTTDEEAPLVLTRAVERISQRVLIVAAAGNHGNQRGWQNGRTSRSSIWPAALPDVVAVGAHDGNGNRAEFSPNLPWVDCEAPGVNVVGAYLSAPVKLSTGEVKNFEGYARWSGTSFAAPIVSGLIAAHMTPDKSAREALDDLLHEKTVVKPFTLSP